MPLLVRLTREEGGEETTSPIASIPSVYTMAPLLMTPVTFSWSRGMKQIKRRRGGTTTLTTKGGEF
jgi:hypothetical protein